MKRTGWFNESKRHSLASRGIKTAHKFKIGQCVMWKGSGSLKNTTLTGKIVNPNEFRDKGGYASRVKADKNQPSKIKFLIDENWVYNSQLKPCSKTMNHGQYSESDNLALLERGRKLHFQSKEERDKFAQKCMARGIKVKKSRSINQQLHPEYVSDYKGEIETGFGNTQYRTLFPVLYNLEVSQ